MPKTQNLILDVDPLQSHPFFPKAGTFFLSIRRRDALCMNTLDTMSQLVSSCSSWCYYQRNAREMQVCVSMKADKDKSLRLIVKSEVMIALCEDASQMYY